MAASTEAHPTTNNRRTKKCSQDLWFILVSTVPVPSISYEDC